MPQTFLPKIYKRGFSLIEIMVAVFIFAGSILFILPFLQKSENELRKSLRQLQALNQNLYTRSRVENRAYRIAIQTQLQNSSYWVEVKKTDHEQPAEELEDKEEIEETPLASKEKPPEHPFFKKDTSFFEPQNLPEGVYFEPAEPEEESEIKIETEQNIFYITYDPHRFSRSIKLFLRKDSSPPSWTLLFNSLSGELELIRKT